MVFLMIATMSVGSIIGWGIGNFITAKMLPATCAKLGIDTGKNVIDIFKK